MSVASLVILSASGLFVGALGYLIRNRGALELVAGYDPDEVRDEAGLAAFVGTNLYYVAVLTLLMGVLDYLGASELWVGYGLALLGLTVWLLVGSKRYQ